jgi:hypothetical protein
MLLAIDPMLFQVLLLLLRRVEPVGPHCCHAARH